MAEQQFDFSGIPKKSKAASIDVTGIPQKGTPGQFDFSGIPSKTAIPLAPEAGLPVAQGPQSTVTIEKKLRTQALPLEASPGKPERVELTPEFVASIPTEARKLGPIYRETPKLEAERFVGQPRSVQRTKFVLGKAVDTLLPGVFDDLPHKQISEIAQKEVPGALKAGMVGTDVSGELLRLLLLDRFVGPIVGKFWVTGKGAGLISKLPNIGKVAARQAARTGSVFGALEATRQIPEVVKGKPIGEAAKEIGLSTATGTALGSTAMIPSVAGQILADAAIGFGTTKLRGGDDLDAATSAAVFGLFRAVNAKGIKQQIRNAYIQDAKEAMAQKFVDQGISTDQASRVSNRFMDIFVKKAGGAEKVTPKAAKSFRDWVAKNWQFNLNKSGIPSAKAPTVARTVGGVPSAPIRTNERVEAINRELSKLERIRQSAVGREGLKRDLFVEEMTRLPEERALPARQEPAQVTGRPERLLLPEGAPRLDTFQKLNDRILALQKELKQFKPRGTVRRITKEAGPKPKGVTVVKSDISDDINELPSKVQEWAKKNRIKYIGKQDADRFGNKAYFSFNLPKNQGETTFLVESDAPFERYEARRNEKLKEFAPKPAEAKKPVEKPKVPDQKRIQELKNSISEGELILRTGKINDRQMSKDELAGVKRSVESSKAKLSELTGEPKPLGAKKVKKPVSAKEEFKVGDILDPQGNTNMEGQATIREISGNTLKFVDSKGKEYSGMQRSMVRRLLEGGSWKRVAQKPESVKPVQERVSKLEELPRHVRDVSDEQKLAFAGTTAKGEARFLVPGVLNELRVNAEEMSTRTRFSKALRSHYEAAGKKSKAREVPLKQRPTVRKVTKKKQPSVPGKQKKAAKDFDMKPVSPDDLNLGDKVKIQGEKFEVIEKTKGGVRLEDGTVELVDVDESIEVDGGKIEKPKATVGPLGGRVDEAKKSAAKADITKLREYEFTDNVGDRGIVKTGRGKEKVVILDRYIEDGQARYTVYPPGKKQAAGARFWVYEKDFKTLSKAPVETVKQPGAAREQIVSPELLGQAKAPTGKIKAKGEIKPITGEQGVGLFKKEPPRTGELFKQPEPKKFGVIRPGPFSEPKNEGAVNIAISSINKKLLNPDYKKKYIEFERGTALERFVKTATGEGREFYQSRTEYLRAGRKKLGGDYVKAERAIGDFINSVLEGKEGPTVKRVPKPRKVSELPIMAIQLETLKPGDRYIDAKTTEVMFVTGKNPDGTVNVQDGTKKTLSGMMVREIRGEVNGPETTFAGGQLHEPGRRFMVGETGETRTFKGYGKIESGQPKPGKTSASRTPKEVTETGELKGVPMAMDQLLKVVAPSRRTGITKETARILRSRLAQLAQKQVANEIQLRKAHRAFNFMSQEKSLDFMDRMENGTKQEDPKFQAIAKQARELLDQRRKQVQALGKGHLEKFYENYFPHIWKDPKGAEGVIAKILGRRPLAGTKSFLKKRSIVTVKEGVEAGLEPVSWNPVDQVLYKVHEMDRFIMAQNLVQDLKARGLIKFKYARAKMPNNFKALDDSIFTVYMPPYLTVDEAFDKILVEDLMAFAESMGINAKRLMKLKARTWWGYAMGDSQVRTKFAGPENVLVHEIGHTIGSRYNLYEWMTSPPGRKFETGKRAGQEIKADARRERVKINKQLRALADARFEQMETSNYFKKYVRKAEEKEAVMLEAFIHAPKVMKEVAPDVYDRFKSFLNSRSELRPLLDIRTSVVLGGGQGRLDVPGITKLGEYIASENVATLINNHLRAGLRSADNVLVAGAYDLLRKSANTLNFANLSLSMFHGLNTTTDVMATTLGLGLRKVFATEGQALSGLKDIASTPVSPFINLWRGGQIKKLMEQDLLQMTDPKHQEIVKNVILAGGRSQMDMFYHNQATKALIRSVNEIARGTIKEKFKGVAKFPVNTLMAAIETTSKPIMQWLVPRQKLGAFYMLARHEIARAKAGKINDEEFHERLSQSWDNVDNRMGQLVYDNLFWNKTMKDALMMAVRSVGWNLGSWREFGGAPVDFLNVKKRLGEGDAWMSQKMAYAMGAAIIYSVLGAVLTYLMTGKGPRELKDYFFPRTGKKNADGSDERLSLPTYAKDWFAYATRPLVTLSHKLHPIWSTLSDVARNEDFYGTEIRHEDDPLMKQLVDSAEFFGESFLPFSVKNYIRMTKQGRDPLTAAAVSITGIQSAPSYVTRSHAQKLATEYIIARLPRGTRTKEQFTRSDRRKQLKMLARVGKDIDGHPLAEGFTSKETKRIKTDAGKTPFAETFNRLTIEEALNVYAVASAKERAQVRDLIEGKFERSSKNEDPEIRQLYKELGFSLKPKLTRKIRKDREDRPARKTRETR